MTSAFLLDASLLSHVTSVLELGGIPGLSSQRSPSVEISALELVPQVLLGLELSSSGECSSPRRRYDIYVQLMERYIMEYGVMGIDERWTREPPTEDKV